jgi:ribosome-associated protein
VISFKLNTEFIELFKLLKITGLCQSGGHAKHSISEGLVRVDGQVETRKACKIRAGQKIEFGDEVISVEPQ